MNGIEAIAFALGVANVMLVVRRSVWNYPFGIAMVALYGVVFLQARLYSDALLQIFFLVVNIYGWATWARLAARTGDIAVETMGARERWAWAAGWLVATIVWGTLMARFTAAALPWWDAGVAIASVAAQIMMARRRIENWVVWIAVDIASIGLYAAKGLRLTMVLYMVFLLLSVWGLMDWRRASRRMATGA